MSSPNYAYKIMENTDGNGNKKYFVVRNTSYFSTGQETFCLNTKYQANDEYKHYDSQQWQGFSNLSKKERPARSYNEWDVILVAGILFFIYHMLSNEGANSILLGVVGLFSMSIMLFTKHSVYDSPEIERSILYFRSPEEAKKLIRSFAAVD